MDLLMRKLPPKVKNTLSIPSINSFNKFNKLVKWCTPGVLPELNQIYDSSLEASISITSPGKLQNNTGVFKEINMLATKTYKNFNGHSHFCCEGSTGSNRVLFDLIRKIFLKTKGDWHILASRNVHQSIVVNGRKNKIPIKYLSSDYDFNTGLFLPSRIDDILNSITSETKMILLSNPTYEGFSINLCELIEKVKIINPEVLVYIDEAWGSHFSFSSKLPISAIEAGADFVVQSLHKQGGAPNPASIIHLSERVTFNYYEEFLISYDTNTSTTYSYPLVAQMDLTRYIFDLNGERIISDVIKNACLFREQVRLIKGIRIVEDFYLKDNLYKFDLTKINLDLSQTEFTGDYVSSLLEEEYGIITEKEELYSLCFLTTINIGQKEIDYTINALKRIFEDTEFNSNKSYFGELIPKKLEQVYYSYEIDEMEKESILLEDSKGKILAENIKCYPPGIYIAQVGELINGELINYLKSQRKRSNFHAYDKSLKYILVVKEN